VRERLKEPRWGEWNRTWNHILTKSQSPIYRVMACFL